MSFTCQNCGEHQQPGIKPYKVVTEVRKVIYPPVRDRENNIRYIPEGFENVSEINVCQKCKHLEYYCDIAAGTKIIEERMEY